jgi:hypothetical protein
MRYVLTVLGLVIAGVLLLGASFLSRSSNLVDAAMSSNSVARWMLFRVCPKRDDFLVNVSVRYVLSTAWAEDWNPQFIESFVERLLDCGASAGGDDPWENPMDAAAFERDEEVIRLLLRHGGKSTQIACENLIKHETHYLRELRLGICDSWTAGHMDANPK